MATIVRVKSTGNMGVLVGTGFGLFRTARPSMVWGNLSPIKEEGEAPVAAISDDAGIIHWAHTDDLEVISVGGVSPKVLLAG